MSYFIAALYYLCFIVLIGLAAFIFRKDPKAWLNRYFALFSLAIFGWLATYYLFKHQADTPLLTLTGRANFAFAAFIVLFGYLFLPQVAGKHARFTRLLIIETVLLAAVTSGTSLIDHSEHIVEGQHVTEFGPLFPLYIAHLVGYIVAAFYITFIASRKEEVRVRGQLAVIGLGMSVMAAIALVTNIILPYGFHIFSLQDIGGLSTLFLLAAIAYAILARHLFDIRIVIKRTLVYTLLLAAIAGGYSAVEFLLKEALQQTAPGSQYPFITSVGGTIIVSLFVSPVRRWLEKKIDSLLFKRRHVR